MKARSLTCKGKNMAFTLVELLVVISIIALLMAVLLPSLNRARKSAWAVRCGANAKNVAMAMEVYVVSNDGYYPASYLYCAQRGTDTWDIKRQDYSYQGNGYIHWSYFLFYSGACDETAFECPAIPHNGIPRTNPGLLAENWEKGQVDMDGRSGSNSSLGDFGDFI